MRVRARILFLSLALSFLVSVVFLGLGGLVSDGRLQALRRNTFSGAARTLARTPDLAANYGELRRFLREREARELPLWVISAKGEVLFDALGKPLPESPERILALASRLQPAEVFQRNCRWNPVSPCLVLVRFPDESGRVLALFDLGAGPVRNLGLTLLLTVFVATLLVWIVFGFLLLAYSRLKAGQLEEAFARIQAGDASVRLPLNRFDRLAGVLPLFNQVAERLEDAFARLKESESSRLRLLQELAHDIRTPLTSLKTATDAMSMQGAEVPEESRRTLVDVIRNEVDYLERLIADLFFLAELQIRRVELKAVDLQGVVQEVVDVEARRMGRERPLSVTLAVEPGLEREPARFADGVMLRRLVTNVLENAARAASGRIEVSCGRDAREAWFRVRDDGPGMTEEQLRGFGFKRRVREFDRARFKGSLGLGSVIIRALVEHLNGRLEVANRSDGAGLEVTVRLPVE